MYSRKKQRIERINSISDCFNDLLDDLRSKKIPKEKFINQTLSSKRNEFSGEKNTKYEGLSLDKIIYQNKFDKKYTEIMGTLTPKSSFREEICNSPKEKNSFLWNLKLKTSNKNIKDQSLKRLENFKLNIIYDKQVKNSKTLSDISNGTFAINKFNSFSNSDFLKSTINSNSDAKTFYTSRNSFNNNNNNLNFLSNNIENLSFYSFKASNSTAFYKPKNNKSNNFSVDSPNSRLSSPSKDNKQDSGCKRVDFVYFDTIGENPYKINVYDKNNPTNLASNVRKKHSENNISPKNIYSPNKNGLSYYSHKHFFDIDHLYTNKANYDQNNAKDKTFSPSMTERKNINNNNQRLIRTIKKSQEKLEKEFNEINLNKNDINLGINSKKFSNAVSSNRQFTLKRIDNLLKNF